MTFLNEFVFYYYINCTLNLTPPHPTSLVSAHASWVKKSYDSFPITDDLQSE